MSVSATSYDKLLNKTAIKSRIAGRGPVFHYIYTKLKQK